MYDFHLQSRTDVELLQFWKLLIPLLLGDSFRYVWADIRYIKSPILKELVLLTYLLMQLSKPVILSLPGVKFFVQIY